MNCWPHTGLRSSQLFLLIENNPSNTKGDNESNVQLLLWPSLSCSIGKAGSVMEVSLLDSMDKHETMYQGKDRPLAGTDWQFK